MFSSQIPYRLIVFVLLFSFVITAAPIAEAQGPNGSQIQFTGAVEAVDNTVVTVSGLQVDISLITISAADLDIGMTVSVSGVFDGTMVTAAVVIIVAESPVQVEVPADESTPPESEPPETPTDSSEIGPVIVIEGPVQSINVNIITVFDIDVQVEPADPILTDLQIGDYVRVAGDSNFVGGNIIIVAVTVVIVNIEVIVDGGLPANCKRTKKGRITCKRTQRTRR